MEMIAYDLAWYKSYERSSFVDEAKKYLEYAVVIDLIQTCPTVGQVWISERRLPH